MHRSGFVMIALLALAAGSAHAQCPYPQAPPGVPDGATATYDEMIEARKLIIKFDADIRAYNTCMELDVSDMLANPQLSEAARQNLLNQLAERNDAAVGHAEQVAARFNEQLRVFRERGDE